MDEDDGGTKPRDDPDDLLATDKSTKVSDSDIFSGKAQKITE
jgi:hypothetical protein